MKPINYAKEAARNKKERKAQLKKARVVEKSHAKQRALMRKSNSFRLTSKGVDAVLDYLSQLDPQEMSLPVVIRSNPKRRWWENGVSKEVRLRMEQMGLGLVTFLGQDGCNHFWVLVPHYHQRLWSFFTILPYLFLLLLLVLLSALVMGTDKMAIVPLFPWLGSMCFVTTCVGAAHKIFLYLKPRSDDGLSFEFLFAGDDMMKVYLRDERDGFRHLLKVICV